ETSWLPDAARLPLPPMRPADRMRLIAEVLVAQDNRLTDATRWLELSTASRGNPMILVALVNRALGGNQVTASGDLIDSLRAALGEDVDAEVLHALAMFQGRTDLVALHFMGLDASRCGPVLARLSAIGAAQRVGTGIWLLHPS